MGENINLPKTKEIKMLKFIPLVLDFYFLKKPSNIISFNKFSFVLHYFDCIFAIFQCEKA